MCQFLRALPAVPEGVAPRPYGASKKENFCLPPSILSEAKDCYGARLLSAPKERLGWEAARPCVSKEAKPAKIDSLIEKIFCACPLKNVSIFTGFVQRSGGEPLGGIAARRAAISRGSAGNEF